MVSSIIVAEVTVRTTVPLVMSIHLHIAGMTVIMAVLRVPMAMVPFSC